uniref:Uncharacterized protein n=1 Tax=Oryza rufipogon TaxID=4529 RepID=A0A0E0QFQ7_ORYRU
MSTASCTIANAWPVTAATVGIGSATRSATSPEGHRLWRQSHWRSTSPCWQSLVHWHPQWHPQWRRHEGQAKAVLAGTSEGDDVDIRGCTSPQCTSSPCPFALLVVIHIR